jgi:HSP20 family protein
VVGRIFHERRDMGDDLRRLLDLLDEGPRSTGTAGECTPPFDLIETATSLELLMDLPGVTADAVQILFARNTLVVAGQKLPSACEHRDAAFHLAERAFGRFARAVRLTGAVDGGRAQATLRGGELHVVLPRIDERRGAEIRIPVRTD